MLPNLNAAFVWIGTGGTLNNTGTINNTGSFVGGDGTFSGSLFTNPSGGTIGLDGYVATCLTFSNGLSNAGTMLFQINGSAACTQRDNITVTGEMTFGGTFTASGSPDDGTYTLMTYGSRTGTFSNTSALLTNGKYLNIRASEYGATTLTAVVASSVLGVELTQLGATTEGSKNHLTWATASETDNKHFDIERSTDGITFLSIGQVRGNNKPSSYQYVDASPFTMSYYRLKQVDYDGTTTYSKVVSVEQKGKGKGLKVYPTLVSNGILTLDTDGTSRDNREGGDYSIYNIVGQQVQSGKTTHRLDVSALAKGTYILKVGTEQAKFVKQ